MEDLNILIKNSNLKLSAFLEELNIKRTTFYRIRTGKRELRPNEIRKIARMLNLSICEIEYAAHLLQNNN